MHSVSARTIEILEAVEQSTQHRFQYREEIVQIVELASRSKREEVFEDILFFSKFIWNSYNVMKRIGTENDGYPKLAEEFRTSIEKMTTLLKTLVKDGPEELKENMKIAFFSISHDSMDNLLELSHDLSRMKNYSIDTKQKFF